MNATSSPQSDPEQVRESITAYLDGELPADQAREIEDRLARDGTFREDLQSLQHSWELLDELPRAEADPNFAASTVEMIAITASDEPHAAATNGRGLPRWLGQCGILAGSVMAACLVGFLVTSGVAALLRNSGVLTNSNEQLLRDLPILENLDPYLLIEDIEFLRALHQISPVADEPARAVPVPGERPSLDEPNSQRRDRVGAMSAAEKQGLETNRLRFSELSPEKQRKLHELHRALVTDEDRDELMTTMLRYYHWYRQLPPEKRVHLSGRPVDERLVYVKQALAKHEQELKEQRVVHDVRAVLRWSEAMAVKYQAQLTRGLPEARRRELLSTPEPQRRRRLTMMLWQQWRRGVDVEQSPISREDLSALKSQLSPESQQQLDTSQDPAKVWRQFFETLPQQFRRTVAASGRFSAPLAATAYPGQQWLWLSQTLREDASVRPEQLMRFYREKLPKEAQERLKHLPREEVLRVLKQEYLRAMWKKGGVRPGGAIRRKGDSDAAASGRGFVPSPRRDWPPSRDGTEDRARPVLPRDEPAPRRETP